MFGKSHNRIAALLLLGILGGVGFAADTKEDEEEIKHPFSLKFIDENGKPIDGATAGILAIFGFKNDTTTPVDGTGWRYLFGTTSNEEGVANFPDGRDRDHLCVVARHTGRKLVGILKLEAEMRAPKTSSEIANLTLHPECRVSGRLVCSDLLSRNREVGAAFVRLCSLGNIAFEISTDDSKDLSFHFFVPPGDYALKPYGDNIYPVERPFSVQVGQHELDLGLIEIPATRLSLLEGLPAPELSNVECWKNSPALKLANLKGKCVILDFWGYWCGPCVSRMPELFKLYDKHRMDGLEIVGIHIDLGRDENESVNSVERLDQRLTTIRTNVWNGRDIPYPVALVTGKSDSLGTKGETSKAISEISEIYGITGYPTLILIDRKGNVVGKFHPELPKHVTLLEKLLEEQ